MELSTENKLHILADGAKYDVACTSSGVERNGKTGYLGNSRAYGICHSFSSDGRCISLLKVLMSNHCIYDCKYCINRKQNDIERTTFRPEELCNLTMEFYRRNYIEGLFLSSGIISNPAYTMQLLCDTLRMLREQYHFYGYIHVKAVPGAPEDLIERVGAYADRMSINLELPTEKSMRQLAPNKSFQTILTPMRNMSERIKQHRLLLGKPEKMERSRGNQYLTNSIFYAQEQSRRLQDSKKYLQRERETGISSRRAINAYPQAGMSTQMIIGATDETDYQLIKTTQLLYQRYDLKRVFYSAYIPINEDTALPSLDAKPPLKREHRLYQADWLIRNYGFRADELLSGDVPFFHEELDPKCDWAVRHIERFPIEVNKASYEELLRVPGIGPISARRIVHARRYGPLDFSMLKKMGVVLKRAHFFLVCQGRQMYHISLDESFVRANLITLNSPKKIVEKKKYYQMSLFDDFGLSI